MRQSDASPSDAETTGSESGPVVAPVHEIEVTAEMVAAGRRAFAGFNEEFESIEGRLEFVFLEMYAAWPRARLARDDQSVG